MNPSDKASTDFIFDYEKWEKAVGSLTENYRKADPFPSVVIDDFLNPVSLKKALAEFPSPSSSDWMHYTHVNEKKLAQPKRSRIPLPFLEIIDELSSPRFLTFLSKLTGINGLLPDPDLEGGGMHQIQKGGYLNIHADFTAHPYHDNWARRVNVLVYLNEEWQDAYGGHLQLWDKQAKKCVKKILPVFNRCVIFSTDPNSFHGHPEPLTCPENRTRRSLALYYFTEESSPIFVRSTEYRSRPEDSLFKKVAIYLDKFVLRTFDFSKRKFGISNDLAIKILRFFSK